PRDNQYRLRRSGIENRLHHPFGSRRTGGDGLAAPRPAAQFPQRVRRPYVLAGAGYACRARGAPGAAGGGASRRPRRRRQGRRTMAVMVHRDPASRRYGEGDRPPPRLASRWIDAAFHGEDADGVIAGMTTYMNVDAANR